MPKKVVQAPRLLGWRQPGRPRHALPKKPVARAFRP